MSHKYGLSWYSGTWYLHLRVLKYPLNPDSFYSPTLGRCLSPVSCDMPKGTPSRSRSIGQPPELLQRDFSVIFRPSDLTCGAKERRRMG